MKYASTFVYDVWVNIWGKCFRVPRNADLTLYIALQELGYDSTSIKDRRFYDDEGDCLLKYAASDRLLDIRSVQDNANKKSSLLYVHREYRHLYKKHKT